MRGSKRAVATAVVVLMTLPLIADGANGQSTREENLQEVPVAVSTLTAAMLEERLVPTDAEFVPISFGGDQTNPPTRILSAAALTFAFENQVSNWLGLWDLERTQVLSGPQGTLYGRPGINIRSEGSPDFYTTNSVATGYLAKVEPLPEFSSDEIFEISLAFSWFGEKAFVNTTFAFDPLVGYANFVNSAIIGGEPTNAYGKVVGEEWGQFADPLVGFDFTDADGAYYIGYVLPGIPEAAAFTLSYSPEPSLDAMVAQQVPITQSEVFEFPALEATVGILDGDLQLSYIGFEDDIAAGGESPIEQPPPTTGEPEQPVDAEEPTTTVALDPEPEEQGMDEVVVLADEPGGSSLLLPVVSGGALAALAAWFMMGRRRKEKLGHTTSAVEHSPQSAGEEIIGQGEAFGLPVVAGWQQIPFGTGGEFQPGGGRVDAAALNEETDVVFAGHPVQWTFDPRRFAFWVKPIQKPGPDGKRYELKVGSPADPNAYPEIAVPPPLQPDPGPIERNEATMASAIDTVVMSGLSEAAEDPPIKGGPTNQRVLIPGPGTCGG